MWLVHVKRFLNPLLSRLAFLTLYRQPLPDVWSHVSALPEQEFFNTLNRYAWLRCPLWGLWDFIPENPNLFFSNQKEFPWLQKRTWSRDCGSWADLSFRWAVQRGYDAWLLLLYDGNPYRKGHYTCVFRRPDGTYALADYGIRGEAASLDDAMELFRTNTWLREGPYPNLVWHIYKEAIVHGTLEKPKITDGQER